MRVYLVEPNSRYDLTALIAYGQIEYISKGSLNPFNIGETLRKIKAGLVDFDPTEDYLCLTGNLLSVSMLTMVAYSLFKSFKILAFDARTSNYRERLVVNE